MSGWRYVDGNRAANEPAYWLLRCPHAPWANLLVWPDHHWNRPNFYACAIEVECPYVRIDYLPMQKYESLHDAQRTIVGHFAAYAADLQQCAVYAREYTPHG